jgi:EpsI family protein
MNARTRVFVSLTLLLGTLGVLQLRSTGEAVPIRQPLTTLPTRVGEWQGREESALDEATLQILRPTDYLVRRHVDSAGRSAWLYVGYWDSQRRGAQPHSPKNCLPGGGWEPLEAGRLTIPLPAPHAPLVVNRFIIQKDREQQVVLYWYEAQGHSLASEVAARVQMVRSAILRNRTDGAIVRVSSYVQGGVDETTWRLVEYVQALYPILREYVPA